MDSLRISYLCKKIKIHIKTLLRTELLCIYAYSFGQLMNQENSNERTESYFIFERTIFHCSFTVVHISFYSNRKITKKPSKFTIFAKYRWSNLFLPNNTSKSNNKNVKHQNARLKKSVTKIINRHRFINESTVRLKDLNEQKKNWKISIYALQR